MKSDTIKSQGGPPDKCPVSDTIADNSRVNVFTVKHVESQPYRCPVCDGRGIVPSGFYTLANDACGTSITDLKQCRTCKGKGIIWG